MDGRIIADITDFIFVGDKPEKADVIFLPGGSYPALPEYAAELYKAGFAPYLLPSGGLSLSLEKWPGPKSRADYYNGDYKSDCDFYFDALIKNGVPESAVIREDRSRFTKENAFFSRQAADTANLTVKKAIIVCKAFHARRCLMCYGFAFPETEITICPVECGGITKENWHTTRYGVGRVLGELERCGAQFPDAFL